MKIMINADFIAVQWSVLNSASLHMHRIYRATFLCDWEIHKHVSDGLVSMSILQCMLQTHTRQKGTATNSIVDWIQKENCNAICFFWTLSHQLVSCRRFTIKMPNAQRPFQLQQSNKRNDEEFNHCVSECVEHFEFDIYFLCNFQCIPRTQ